MVLNLFHNKLLILVLNNLIMLLMLSLFSLLCIWVILVLVVCLKALQALIFVGFLWREFVIWLIGNLGLKKGFKLRLKVLNKLYLIKFVSSIRNLYFLISISKYVQEWQLWSGNQEVEKLRYLISFSDFMIFLEGVSFSKLRLLSMI